MVRPTKSSKSRKKQVKERSSTRSEVPDVYREMLADTVSSATTINDAGKIIKRRRVAGQIVKQSEIQGTVDNLERDSSGLNNLGQVDLAPHHELPSQQVIYNDSEDSAQSDLNWEEVDLKEGLDEDSSQHSDDQTGELNLVLNEGRSGSQVQGKSRKVPVTAAERRIRLEVHKMHLLCLLMHIHLRNHWCNGEEVHGALKHLLSCRSRSYLNPDENRSQFQRSRSFIDGLKQASDAFRQNFRVNSRGMSRSVWAETSEALNEVSLPRDLELPMQKSDFHAAAISLTASRDVGAQLFCALLRSAGVETRLVCSLQPLPFNFNATLIATYERKPAPPILQAVGHASANNDESDDESCERESSNMPRLNESAGQRSRFLPGIRTTMSQPFQSYNSASRNPLGNVSQTTSPHTNQKKYSRRVKESSYPIYWVEAFNEADQRWITVDPLVTKSVSKPSRFEPPANDRQNSLTYVLAFEDDGSARDVTRRYTKAFNAKTRSGRLDVVQGGDVWWRRVMKIYTRAYNLSRDQIEGSELAAREAAEPMPRNVLNFKNHPYYALERHLKRSEVVHPKREVGKIAVGRSGGDQVLEPIFRRNDVRIVKSGDSWYRLGREVKIGEQPLKYVPSRRRKELVEESDDITGEEGKVGMALYSYDQTKQYSAPPVVHGRIPKNSYGNLDIYVPSMIPEGGVHIPHPDTSRAARVLGVDYADAVTGFTFKGRHGTANIRGAVIAKSCRDAIEEVIGAFEIERQEEEETRKVLEILRMWRKFFVGLRIRERIKGYEMEGEKHQADEIMRGEEEAAHGNENREFSADKKKRTHSRTVSEGRSSQHATGCDEDDGGGFILSDNDFNEANGGGFTLSDRESDEDVGGGFLNEEDEDSATFSKHENNQSSRQTKNGEQEGRLISNANDELLYSPISGVETQIYKIEGLPQLAYQSMLPADAKAENRYEESQSPAFTAKKSQPPTQSPTNPSQARPGITITARRTHDSGRLLPNESSDLTRNEHPPQNQNMKSTNSNPPVISPPYPPSYLPDSELAQALALQQVHDSQSRKLPPPPTTRPTNPSKSSTPPPHQPLIPAVLRPGSASFTSQSPLSPLHATNPSPCSSAPTPTPDPQVISPPQGREQEQEKTEIHIESANSRSVNSISSPQQQQGMLNEIENKGKSNQPNDTEEEEDDDDDDDSSEDAGSLLSRDPSDEDVDPDWLD